MFPSMTIVSSIHHPSPFKTWPNRSPITMLRSNPGAQFLGQEIKNTFEWTSPSHASLTRNHGQLTLLTWYWDWLVVWRVSSGHSSPTFSVTTRPSLTQSTSSKAYTQLGPKPPPAPLPCSSWKTVLAKEAHSVTATLSIASTISSITSAHAACGTGSASNGERNGLRSMRQPKRSWAKTPTS